MAGDGFVRVNGAIPDTAGETVRQDYTDGAGHVVTQSGSVWAYGDRPETWYLPGTSAAADATDNTAHGGIQALQYEGIVFDTTAGEVTVQASIDGTNWQAVDLTFIDLGSATRALVATTTGGTGPFLLETPFYMVRFLNDGAVLSTVRFAQVGKLPAIAR